MSARAEVRQDTAEILTALKAGRTPARPLFAPMFAAAAAEVDGSAPALFVRDAGRMSVVLRELGEALPVDALFADSGSLWDLELCGLSARLEGWPPVAGRGGMASAPMRPLPETVQEAGALSPAIETLRRLRSVLPHGFALGVVVEGPAALASSAGIDPSEWAGALVAIARLALEAGATVIALAEGEEPPADPARWASDLAPFWGVIRFYQGVGALLLTDAPADWVHVIEESRPAVPVVVDEEAGDLLRAARKQGPWGLALHPSGGRVPLDGASLVTTAGDLLGHIPVEELRETVRAMAARAGR